MRCWNRDLDPLLRTLAHYERGSWGVMLGLSLDHEA